MPRPFLLPARGSGTETRPQPASVNTQHRAERCKLIPAVNSVVQELLSIKYRLHSPYSLPLPPHLILPVDAVPFPQLALVIQHQLCWQQHFVIDGKGDLLTFDLADLTSILLPLFHQWLKLKSNTSSNLKQCPHTGSWLAPCNLILKQYS